jgi:hypothetical protein
MMRTLGFVVCCATLVAGCAPLKIAADVPLADQAVAPPDADAPGELAAFSGRWVGVWTDGKSYRKNMALIIDRVVAPDRASGFYGCGHALPKPNPVCPSSMPVSGRLENGVLKIAYPAIQAEGRYRISGGSLDGQMVDWNSGKVLIWVTATRLR